MGASEAKAEQYADATRSTDREAIRRSHPSNPQNFLTLPSGLLRPQSLRRDAHMSTPAEEDRASMRDHYPTQRARRLRASQTAAEQQLWRHLRKRQMCGQRFRRQHPFRHVVLDFVCLELALVIEVDGGQHSDSANDRRRDEWLRCRGFRVLRFWNDDVLLRCDQVLAEIHREVLQAQFASGFVRQEKATRERSAAARGELI
jgi:very-short-patch-repair endonuclease